MLADVWEAVEVKCGVDEDRTSIIDSYVGNILDIMQQTLTILIQIQSIQSWTRSYLVYKVKGYMARLYGFDKNCSPEYIHKQVSW